MKLQNRNLSSQMQGDDVKLLQSELARLGYKIAADEQAKHLFGASTHDAVYDLQKTNGLEATGIVDEKTAALINHLVDALQPAPIATPAKPKPEPEPTPDQRGEKFIVRGNVRSGDGNPLASLTVLARDRDLPSLQRDEPLGESITDTDGFSRIEYTQDKVSRVE